MKPSQQNVNINYKAEQLKSFKECLMLFNKY